MHARVQNAIIGAMTKEEIEHLAELSRIALNEDEKERLAKEVDVILEYVDQIKELTSDASLGTKKGQTGPVLNVFREDKESHEPGIYREDLLEAAPERDGDYVQVKKILDNERK